jgi:hypothetical protein
MPAPLLEARKLRKTFSAPRRALTLYLSRLDGGAREGEKAVRVIEKVHGFRRTRAAELGGSGRGGCAATMPCWRSIGAEFALL